MKRVVSLILICSFLCVISSTAFTEGTSIQFLNTPWLSSISTVKDVVASKLTKDLPTGEFEVKEWNTPTYGDNEVRVPDVPIYTLTYEGRSYYRVADFNVAALTVKFVPNASDGTYSNVNFDDYAFIEAMYRFDSDAVHDCKDILNELKKKLSSLYGEPTDHYDDNDYEVYFTLNAEGYVWISNEDHSYLELRWAKMSSSFTGTMEHVYLTYAYADKDYMVSKQQAVAVSDGESNLDVGSTDGL